MPIGLNAPDWKKEKHDWPHQATSRFVSVGRHRWHIQRFGKGPLAVFLHGTAASTHSYAALSELLCDRFEVLLIDLPGHGFTSSPVFWQASPEAVAEDIAALLRAEGLAPQVIVGHSAGAVAGIELAHRLAVAPELFVGINGAYKPFEGLARFIAPALAKATYVNPLPAYAFAAAARNTERVKSLIDQTGSSVPERNISLYQRLLRYPAHISGALHLMADWHHEGIRPRFRSLPGRALLVAGADDRAVPAEESQKMARVNPRAVYEEIGGAGHLVHEEKPEAVAGLIADAYFSKGDG
jgi:magnesium chelatase accessory protein